MLAQDRLPHRLFDPDFLKEGANQPLGMLPSLAMRKPRYPGRLLNRTPHERGLFISRPSTGPRWASLQDILAPLDFAHGTPFPFPEPEPAMVRATNSR